MTLQEFPTNVMTHMETKKEDQCHIIHCNIQLVKTHQKYYDANASVFELEELVQQKGILPSYVIFLRLDT